MPFLPFLINLFKMLRRAISQAPPIKIHRTFPSNSYPSLTLKFFSSKKEKEEKLWELLRERDMRDNPHRYKNHWWVSSSREVFKTQENFQKFPQ